METLKTVPIEKEGIAVKDNSWKDRVVKSFRQIGTLDLRALGLLRIGIASVLLLDLCLRMGDLEAHYTNTGILPLSALFDYAWNPYHFSFYTIASSLPLQAFLFLANIICVSCLLLGYRTKLFTFVCWLFLISLHNRNPLIQQAGDDLLRLILFWGLFLPWNYYYSIDRFNVSKINNESTEYSSFAGFAYVLQFFFVYFFSAMLKTSPEWTTDFTALYYALSLDQILMPFGKLIYPFEGMLKVLTAATYYTEMLLPFVLFIPFFTGWFRLLFFTIITTLHIGIALSLNVGLFPLISTVAMLGLLPNFFIDKVDLKLKKLFQNLVIQAKKVPTKKGRPFFPKERPFIAVIAIFFIFYTFLWNLRTVGVPLSEFGIKWVGHLVRVDQYWSMFAPSVFKDDGWFILEGTTEEGDQLDLRRHGEPITFDKPSYVAGTYKNDRWRKYAENILFVFNSHYRLYYCGYILKKWNRNNPEKKIHHLEVIYMKTPSLPNYEEDGPFEERLCTCDL